VKSILAACASLALLTGLASSQATAPPAAPVAGAAGLAPAPNWYNVEVILFRNTDPVAGSQETWPADPGEPNWNGAQPLNPPDPANPPVPYQLLAPASTQLTDQWNRLKHSHELEPLLDVVWTQPALDRATAPAVRIGLPPPALPGVSTASAAVAATPARPAATAKTPMTAAPPQATPAYGTVKLSTTGPYLHLDLDLALRGAPIKTALPAPATISAVNMSAPAAGTTAGTVTAAPSFQLYRLQQDRRVDAGKVYYFDHPLFGALVLVTPVKKQ
jgi:hypothetical protein